jgi:hypothetical protein
LVGLVIAIALYTYCERLPRKRLTKEKPTNVLITGGA